MTTKNSFTITANWIHSNRTPRGAWTAKQLAAIGVAWPPANGWVNRKNGTTISMEAAQRFEKLAKEGKPLKKRTPPVRSELGVVTSYKPMPPTQCNCTAQPWEECLCNPVLSAIA